MAMDPEMKELRELLRRQLAVAEDTNRTVHRLRRGVLWGHLFQLVWWLAIFAVSAGAYYFYLQPYVVKLESLYLEVQQGGQKAQSALQQLQTEQQQITNLIAHPFGSGATASTTQ